MQRCGIIPHGKHACQDIYLMVIVTTMYRLTEHDLARLVTACKVYKDQTGSEFMWDEYDHLQKRLTTYMDQNYEEEKCEL